MLALLTTSAPWILLGAGVALVVCDSDLGAPLTGLAILWLVVRIYPS